MNTAMAGLRRILHAVRAAVGATRCAWLAALAVLASPAVSQACTCSWTGPFLTVAPRAEFVIRAHVMRHTERRRGIDLAMEVEVLEVLKGRHGSRRLRIWGDNGAQCRPYVSGFPPGTDWLFALSRALPREGSSGDYALSMCGEYWARVTAGEAVGRLASPRPPAVNDDNREKMPLEEMRRRLRAAKP